MTRGAQRPSLHRFQHAVIEQNTDWDWVTGMIDRIKAVGYQGFCLTVDSALYSRRERPMISRWSVDTTRAPQHREWHKVTWDDAVRIRDYAGLPLC